jgi:hypothetical protein
MLTHPSDYLVTNSLHKWTACTIGSGAKAYKSCCTMLEDHAIRTSRSTLDIQAHVMYISFLSFYFIMVKIRIVFD